MNDGSLKDKNACLSLRNYKILVKWSAGFMTESSIKVPSEILEAVLAAENDKLQMPCNFKDFTSAPQHIVQKEVAAILQNV